MTPCLMSQTLRHMLSLPRRLLRSRGFGVHSPFAYSFVKDVLAMPCSYYALGDVGLLARSHGLPRRLLELVFRTCVFFDCRSALCAGPSADVFADTLRLTRSDFRILSAESETAQMIVADGYIPGLDSAAARCVASGGILLFHNLRRADTPLCPLWQSLTGNATCGMAFRGGNTAIFVGRPHLPHSTLSLWI